MCGNGEHTTVYTVKAQQLVHTTWAAEYRAGGYRPSLSQKSELGGLVSHCVNLGTQTCMQYHSYI